MTTRPPDRQPGRERAALFRSLAFREHDTGDHPENAGRLLAIDTALERLDLLAGRPEIPFPAAPDDVLARVHDPRYIAGIREFSAQGGGWLDADTACRPKLGRGCGARRRSRRSRRRGGPRRPGTAWFRPGQTSWAPCHPLPGHGILFVQYDRRCRRPCARSRPGPGVDRRLGRPPRQWHSRRLLRDR